MGAKFIVDRRCEVKRSLTLTGLIKGLQYQTLLRQVSDLAAAGALADCDADARVDLVMPTEQVPEDLTIRELQEHTAALFEHRNLCRTCPSSMKGHVGGCIGYIPYPISEGMEFLLWQTAVQGLTGELPETLLPRVVAFAEKARAIRRTPFADQLRSRGDLLGLRARLFQHGPIWSRTRLSSSQVLDLFFKPGVVAGDDLRILAGFLFASLQVARALEPAIHDEEQRLSMADEIRPYAVLYDLMTRALQQSMGIYVWP
ncbi:MAG: hypothetical protein ACOY94_28610 [Bacillota bacterium]